MTDEDDAHGLKRSEDLEGNSRMVVEGSDCKGEEKTVTQEIEEKDLEFGLLRKTLFLEMELLVKVRDLLDHVNRIEQRKQNHKRKSNYVEDCVDGTRRCGEGNLKVKGGVHQEERSEHILQAQRTAQQRGGKWSMN